VRKAPQKASAPATFTLHVGDCGTDDVNGDAYIRRWASNLRIGATH
jgi:hypothetical protein